MKAVQSRRRGVRKGTRHVGRPFVKVVYERVMVRSLIIQAHTHEDRWRMYQLGWLVLERIGHDSHLTKVINKIFY